MFSFKICYLDVKNEIQTKIGINNFRLISIVGEGNFSTVVLGIF